MKFVPERDLTNPIIVPHRYYFTWIRPFLKKAKVLDIGCWTGPMESLLEHESCKVTATDIEERPLIVARKRFPSMRFVKASIVEETKFKKKEFDVVLFFMVIEHVPKGSELAALIRINRIMKKGGNLFLTTMNSTFFSNLFDPAYFLIGHRHYSKKHLSELLGLAGFQIKEVHYNGGIWNIVYAFLLYFFKHVLRKPEPKGGIMDKLMETGYKNNGFNEIDIRAVKVNDVQ